MVLRVIVTLFENKNALDLGLHQACADEFNFLARTRLPK